MKTMSKELEKCMKMSHIENTNKEPEIFFN